MLFRNVAATRPVALGTPAVPGPAAPTGSATDLAQDQMFGHETAPGLHCPSGVVITAYFLDYLATDAD